MDRVKLFVARDMPWLETCKKLRLLRAKALSAFGLLFQCDTDRWILGLDHFGRWIDRLMNFQWEGQIFACSSGVGSGFHLVTYRRQLRHAEEIPSIHPISPLPPRELTPRCRHLLH